MACRKEKQGILWKCIWLWSPRMQKKVLQLGCSEILFSRSPAVWKSEQEKDAGVAQLTKTVSQGMMMDLALPLLELPWRPHMWSAPFMHRTHQHVDIAKRAGMDSLKAIHTTEGTSAWFCPQGPACSVLFHVLHSHETPCLFSPLSSPVPTSSCLNLWLPWFYTHLEPVPFFY